MGRWERNRHDDKRQIQAEQGGAYIGHALIPPDATIICNAHNADCDAYEAKIAELQRRLDAIVAIANKLPDKLYVYREFAGVTYKDRSVKDELIALAEGKGNE